MCGESKIYLGILAILAFVLIAGCVSDPAEDAAAEESALPTVSTIDGNPHMVVLDFSGKTHREVGVEYGKWIKENYPNYSSDMGNYYESLLYFFQSRAGVVITDEDVSGRLAEIKPNVPQGYIDEVEGIAEGLGEPEFADVLLKINLFSDIGRPASCSGFATYGEYTNTGKTIMGRNFDWYGFDALQEYSGATVFRNQEGKNDFVNIGYLGIVSVASGVNEKNLGMHVQDCGTKQNLTLSGRHSYTFSVRETLEDYESVDPAMEFYNSREYSYSHIVLFFDELDALVLEKAANLGTDGTTEYAVRTSSSEDARTAWGLPERIALTNHYEITSMDSKAYSGGIHARTQERFLRIRELLSGYSAENPLDAENAQKIMSDGQVAFLVNASSPADSEETMYSYVYDTANQALYYWYISEKGEPVVYLRYNLFS
jgi:hypothetical protein